MINIAAEMSSLTSPFRERAFSPAAFRAAKSDFRGQ
jgi:hypothetical protein